ncbi:MAG: hypothetical protein AB7G39_18485 [Alphaproteobacteria bacterium]
MSSTAPTGSIPSSALSTAQQYGTFALKHAAQQDQAAVELTKQAVQSEQGDRPPAPPSGPTGQIVDILV